MYPKAFNYIQKYPNVHRYNQSPKCIQMYPDVSLFKYFWPNLIWLTTQINPFGNFLTFDLLANLESKVASSVKINYPQLRIFSFLSSPPALELWLESSWNSRVLHRCLRSVLLRGLRSKSLCFADLKSF